MKRSMHLDFDASRMRLRTIMCRRINVCSSFEDMLTHRSALIQEITDIIFAMKLRQSNYHIPPHISPQGRIRKSMLF